MNPGVVSKLFDIPKIASQIDSWDFEPQRKGILQDCGVAFPRGAICDLWTTLAFADGLDNLKSSSLFPEFVL